MTDVQTDLATIVDQYFVAWNETDADARVSLLTASITNDGRYVDPLADATGPADIADMMGAVQAQYPGVTVRRTSPIDQHHDVLRFHWEILAEDGSPFVDGIDVVRISDDGRLADIHGFFGATVAA